MHRVPKSRRCAAGTILTGAISFLPASVGILQELCMTGAVKVWRSSSHYHGTEHRTVLPPHLSDITDASEDEILTNLVNLALKADEMDNMMVEEFGCEFSEYSKHED